jgi:hypothetical protein
MKYRCPKAIDPCNSLDEEVGCGDPTSTHMSKLWAGKYVTKY